MIAVIEAKDETHTVDAGLEQAKAYARILDVPFAYASNGHGFVEFDFFLNRSRELETMPTPTICRRVAIHIWPAIRSTCCQSAITAIF
jgi:type I restriction enzyme R subunit